jgi:hypothetical protein
MFKKLQKRVWKEDGDLHQDSTYLYSETPGEPSPVHEKGYPSYEAVNRKEENEKRLDEKLREKGLI